MTSAAQVYNDLYGYLCSCETNLGTQKKNPFSYLAHVALLTPAQALCAGFWLGLLTFAHPKEHFRQAVPQHNELFLLRRGA